MSKFFCLFAKITGWLPFVMIMFPKYYYEDKKMQSRRIKGKAIIMPNHHEIWDFATMMFTFYSRNLRCVVAELMYEEKGKAMKRLLRKLGSIRVDRNAHNFTFLDEACQVLESGGVVEFYPEARIPQKNEEKPLPFKSSITYLALMSKAPIIPVVTNGCYWCKKRLRILIGKPIDVQNLYEHDKSEMENIKLITDKLREKIIELNEELKKRTK